MNPKQKALQAQTPFQMIGSGIKKGISNIGKALDKQLVEPSRNVNRIQNAKMQQMNRQAKAGEFN